MKLKLFDKFLIKMNLEEFKKLDYNNMNIWNTKIENDIVSFYCNKNLNAISSIKIIDCYKYNIVKYLGLIITMLCAIVIFYVIPSFTLSIEYQSNSKIDDSVIIYLEEYLSKNHKLNNLNELSNNLKIIFPNYDHISIKKKGCKLLVKIDETNTLFQDNKIYSNIDLTSNYDAYIEGIYIEQGDVLIGYNQTVRKGDLLVKTTLINNYNGIIGLILGRVVEDNVIRIDKNVNSKQIDKIIEEKQYVFLNNNLNSKSFDEKLTLFNFFNIFKINKCFKYITKDITYEYPKEYLEDYSKSIIYNNLEISRTHEKEKIIDCNVKYIKELPEYYEVYLTCTKIINISSNNII